MYPYLAPSIRISDGYPNPQVKLSSLVSLQRQPGLLMGISSDKNKKSKLYESISSSVSRTIYYDLHKKNTPNYLSNNNTTSLKKTQNWDALKGYGSTSGYYLVAILLGFRCNVYVWCRGSPAVLPQSGRLSALNPGYSCHSAAMPLLLF
jgi:hypothetical protein